VGKSTFATQFIVEGTRRDEPGLFVALEEGPAQIAGAASGLGLPLQEEIERGLAEILYLARDRVRPSQLLSLLDDRIRAQKTRRLVIDSVSHLASEGMTDEELRQLLFALVTRFKARGVTTVLTVEAPEMHSSEKITDRKFSPISDNLIALRYARLPEENRPTLTVVKTRGSRHDFGHHPFRIEQGGVRIPAPRPGVPPAKGK
jgi:circadian clock protein KaiC